MVAAVWFPLLLAFDKIYETILMDSMVNNSNNCFGSTDKANKPDRIENFCDTRRWQIAPFTANKHTNCIVFAKFLIFMKKIRVTAAWLCHLIIFRWSGIGGASPRLFCGPCYKCALSCREIDLFGLFSRNLISNYVTNDIYDNYDIHDICDNYDKSRK